MSSFTKVDTGLFISDCGNYRIAGECAAMKGSGKLGYAIIDERTGKVFNYGTLQKMKKIGEFCVKKDLEKRMQEHLPTKEEERLLAEYNK